MQKRSDFTAELKELGLIKRLRDMLVLSVFADEGDDPEGDNKEPQGNTFNFEQMVAQARKEEKEKLYPRIKKLEEENKTLTTSANKYLLENAALKDELEKLRAKSGQDDPKVKDLESEIETLKAENKSLKEGTPNEEEIRKKVEAEYEVKMYAQEQITANKDSIVSILIPEITGATKEEIDTAIASAIEKTVTIKKDLGIDVDEEEDKDNKSTKKKETKEKPKKAPVAVPSTEDEEDYDAEYIRNLDPRSEEYKEFRKKMGLK